MRLLHTSDWHLGQHFMGKSRQAEHQALIDWLLEQCEAQSVDAVIIAGDLFDTGAPPSYARELYNQLVLRLADAGIGLLLLGGNHDSVAVLEESRALLARLGVLVVAAVAPAINHVHLLRKRNGEPGALVCALPFLRPRDLLSSQAGQSADEKQLALQEAIAQHYSACHAAALERRSGEKLAVPIIATGHLTTVGASQGESVREIYVGSLEAFPTAAFPPADYIALGHIHRPQTVGGKEHIRYSGSPLPLAFDEAGQHKEMLLIDLAADGLKNVTPLPVPVFQPLRAIQSNLAELPAAIGQAAALAETGQRVWLEIAISGESSLPDLAARVQAICEPWPVDVLRIRRIRDQAALTLDSASQETLDELLPEEVFARRLAQEELPPELGQALSRNFRIILEQLTEKPG